MLKLIDTVLLPLIALGASAGVSTEELLVRGSVIRELGEFTYNQPLKLSPDAHAEIVLRRYVGEDLDAPLVSQTDVPFRGFPLRFRLTGNARQAFGEETLLLEVRIYNHAGNTPRVGDLFSEYSNEIAKPGAEVEVLASGLEACGTPQSGGFCI